MDIIIDLQLRDKRVDQKVQATSPVDGEKNSRPDRPVSSRTCEQRTSALSLVSRIEPRSPKVIIICIYFLNSRFLM